jgi:hypothetical protein
MKEEGELSVYEKEWRNYWGMGYNRAQWKE